MTKLVSQANRAAYGDLRISIRYYKQDPPDEIMYLTEKLEALERCYAGSYPKEVVVLIKVLAAPAH